MGSRCPDQITRKIMPLTWLFSESSISGAFTLPSPCHRGEGVGATGVWSWPRLPQLCLLAPISSLWQQGLPVNSGCLNNFLILQQVSGLLLRNADRLGASREPLGLFKGALWKEQQLSLMGAR